MNAAESLVRFETIDRVTTLTLNNPKKLNGWTMSMLVALREALSKAASDDDTKVLILTGADPYYCAGVNLSAVIKVDHPAKLHEFIVEQNEGLFDMFLGFPKPIMVAVNGPAIGASVTSMALCDAVIASENATFLTPFAKLGISPEGCSSVMFPKLLGEEASDRMLGAEGWKPSGAEAAQIGLADEVVAHDELMNRAHELAQEWIADDRQRTFKAEMTLEELLAINAQESQELGYAFLGPKFLQGQFDFLWDKGKKGPALVFKALLLSRPLWARLLP